MQLNKQPTHCMGSMHCTMRVAPCTNDHALLLCWPQDNPEVRELFGLTSDEQLVEQFECKLLQTYACNHNTYTPAIQVRALCC